jgi:hypothetical protein
MVTLPGLPMFGHGQIEGYREKYGMEYRQAKMVENVDQGLVQGHEWRIFPLTHRRPLFANVEDFWLYDFFTPQAIVNEDVFAYSNRLGNERGLVIYNNKYAHTSGWIKVSAAAMDKIGGNLVQKYLAQALDLPDGSYTIFKDYVSGQEFIRSCNDLIENGLYVDLAEYQCHVFLDWRFVNGDDWKSVFESLNGTGVGSIYAKHDELFPAPGFIPPAETKPARKASSTKGDKRKNKKGSRTASVTKTGQKGKKMVDKNKKAT